MKRTIPLIRQRTLSLRGNNHLILISICIENLIRTKTWITRITLIMSKWVPVTNWDKETLRITTKISGSTQILWILMKNWMIGKMKWSLWKWMRTKRIDGINCKIRTKMFKVRIVDGQTWYWIQRKMICNFPRKIWCLSD